MSATSSEPETGNRTDVQRTDQPETISSRRLFAGRNTLVIDHEGEHYTLRITSKRKLILTK